MRTLLSISSVVAIVAMMTSCSKTDEGGGKTGLERIWKLTQIATDDNKNGAIDEYEKHNVKSTVDDQLKFNSDSTGYQTVVEAGTPVVYNFKWYYEYPVITRISFGHDTIHYNLVNKTNSTLELQTVIDTILAAYVYKAL